MKNILLTQWCTFCQSFFYVKVKSKKTVRERVTANFVPLKTNNLFKGKVSKYICFCKRYCKTSLCYYYLLKLLLVVKVNYHYKIEMCYVPSKSVSRSQTKFYYVKSRGVVSRVPGVLVHPQFSKWSKHCHMKMQ